VWHIQKFGDAHLLRDVWPCWKRSNYRSKTMYLVSGHQLWLIPIECPVILWSQLNKTILMRVRHWIVCLPGRFGTLISTLRIRPRRCHPWFKKIAFNGNKVMNYIHITCLLPGRIYHSGIASTGGKLIPSHPHVRMSSALACIACSDEYSSLRV